MRRSTKATVTAALLHYGLTSYDGRHCVDALVDLNMDSAAAALEVALSERIYKAPGVRDWQAEEEVAAMREP